MPGGDRKGPAGKGPLTGRAMGYCAGYDRPGFARGGPGSGFGKGMGWRHGWGGGGRGWRGGYGHASTPYPQADETPQQELSMLRQQAEAMQAAQQEMLSRMEFLEQRLREEKD